LYQIGTKELTKLFDFQIQNQLSPDGKKIAYARENNLFVYDLASKKRCKLPLMVRKMPL
jgi:dipeptidyl-peptidase-4